MGQAGGIGTLSLEGMHIVIGVAEAVAAEVDTLSHIGGPDQAYLHVFDEGVAPIRLEFAGS